MIAIGTRVGFMVLVLASLLAGQGTQPPTQETIDALNGQGFTAVPATNIDPATVDGVPLYIGEPGPDDELGEYTSNGGDNSDPRITLFTSNYGDGSNPLLSDALWAQLIAIVAHELFHFRQFEFLKDGGEAEMEACPGSPPDPDCVEEFRERRDCHTEGDAPCIELQAYNNTFWDLCAKAKMEEDPKKKNQLLRQATSACIKSHENIGPCVGRVLLCGSLPNPEDPPSDVPPADCECPC